MLKYENTHIVKKLTKVLVNSTSKKGIIEYLVIFSRNSLIDYHYVSSVLLRSTEIILVLSKNLLLKINGIAPILLNTSLMVMVQYVLTCIGLFIFTQLEKLYYNII